MRSITGDNSCRCLLLHAEQDYSKITIDLTAWNKTQDTQDAGRRYKCNGYAMKQLFCLSSGANCTVRWSSEWMVPRSSLFSSIPSHSPPLFPPPTPTFLLIMILHFLILASTPIKQSFSGSLAPIGSLKAPPQSSLPYITVACRHIAK